MLTQYLALKEAHPDYVLFFQMGDFYELFFDDAVKCAPILEINLTKRGQYQGRDIPMCGVPVHAYEHYLHKLIRSGQKVALCEQMETPDQAKARSGKSLVRRDIVRLITAGTLTEDTLLRAKESAYLLALHRIGKNWQAAWIDLSLGEIWVDQTAPDDLLPLIARLEPKEIILSQSLFEQPEIYESLVRYKQILTLKHDHYFRADLKILDQLYGSKDAALAEGLDPAQKQIAAVLLAYIQETQKGSFPALRPIQRLSSAGILILDPATRRHLELFQSSSGERQHTLLALMDETLTSAGGRMLGSWLAAPLLDRSAIEARQSVVTYANNNPEFLEKTRQYLSSVPDIERALNRLSLGRGSPRDLGAVKIGLKAAQEIRFYLQEFPLPPYLTQLLLNLVDLSFLLKTLSDGLSDDLPVLAREGGMIRRGFSAQFDHAKTLRDEGQKLIKELEARYIAQTSVQSLKIKHNNIIGYHIEVTPLHASKMAEPFFHRQTLGNSVRFSSTELVELEGNLARASEQALALELDIYQDLLNQTKAQALPILQTSSALAAIDVLMGLAVLAGKRNYACPVISDDPNDFDIIEGRHPIVEATLPKDQAFIANDCRLENASRLWLMTGPNMAGKSTFLRQNALIVLMAQMGSFVPATSAKIGLVDRVFSRVGAADDLASGRSTFMVEMTEAATILRQATNRSLVILDELGRGTSTFDGLSIAWGCLEYLHDITRCRGLFATHYHELTQLAEQLDHAGNYRMEVKEWAQDVIFMHKVAAGVAGQSYGIHVAKLAGLPAVVVARAQEVLDQLKADHAVAQKLNDLPLFQVKEVKLDSTSAAEEKLRAIDPLDLSPRQALDLLVELKGMV